MARTTRRKLRPTLEGLEGRQLLSNVCIANAASGKVLDDPNGSTLSGAVIQQFQLNGGLNQQWQLASLSDGNFQIVNAASGLVLGDPNGSTAAGQVIAQFPANGALSQQWQLFFLPNDNELIVNAASGLVLGDPGSSTADGQFIQQFPANGGLNQQWELFGPGGFSVAPQSSGTYALTVKGDQNYPGEDDTITVGVAATGGVTVTVNGQVVAFDQGAISSVNVQPGGSVNVHTPGGTNTINIEQTLSGVPVSINDATASFNNINISPTAGFLINIMGNVSINGGGTNSLTIFDQNDWFNGEIYSLTSSTVARAYSGAINYSGVSSVTLDGGTGADTYNVSGTASGTSTTINAGTGNDTVNVGSATSSLDSVQGALNVNGQAGTDVLNISDQAATTGHTYTLNGSTLTRNGAAAITFGTFGTVNLTAGSHDDALVLTSMPTGVTMDLDMGAGNNGVYGPNTSNTWVINGYSNGEGRADLNGLLYTINGISGLDGGTAPDRFVFMRGGYIPSVINGGGGGDTLDYSNYNTGVNVNLGAYGSGTYGYATAVGSSVSNIRNVIGSPYNDVLTGSKYGNVLVGGGGADMITGGTGTSVLVGGAGTATIHGNSGNDLIVRGYTIFDDNPTALDAIFAEWDSPDSFAQRVAYIGDPTTRGHFNGGYFLNIPTPLQMFLGYRQTYFDAMSNGVFSDTWTTVQGTNWIL
jgi:hypothetical protein